MKELRRLILTSASISNEGHIPSALSVLDLLYVIHKDFLFDEKKLDAEGLVQNRFILSKGHAAIGLYAVLCLFGKISEDELNDFAKFESRLGGHPDRNKLPDVELSTGSLGHGLPQGTGLAMALRLKKLSGHIFVLIGDGEANEGTTWESALLAPNHKLANLTCIIDNNLSSERAVDMGNMAAKFTAFGWETIEIDGHNHDDIKTALRVRCSDKPVAIIANTVKGFGVPSMESKPEWHHRSPNAEELAFFLGELR